MSYCTVSTTISEVVKYLLILHCNNVIWICIWWNNNLNKTLHKNAPEKRILVTVISNPSCVSVTNSEPGGYPMGTVIIAVRF
jgi:hypothetical protein